MWRSNCKCNSLINGYNIFTTCIIIKQNSIHVLLVELGDKSCHHTKYLPVILYRRKNIPNHETSLRTGHFSFSISHLKKMTVPLYRKHKGENRERENDMLDEPAMHTLHPCTE